MKTIRRKKDLIYFCQFLFLFCLLSLASASAQGEARNREPVDLRVGYIYDGDYMYKNSQGEYRGYEVEYIYTLAQEAGWSVSFVDFKDSESSLAALRENQVDLLIGMARTPAREQQFLFSDKKMVTSYMTLMVRPEDERYSYGDLTSLGNITTAARRGSVVVDIYLAWCAQNNLHPRLLLYDNYAQALEALLAGQADSMVVGGVYAFDQTRPVAQFSPSDSYFMIAPQRADVKRQLDAANDKLLMQTPLYELNLTNKYFSQVQGDKPLFTPPEKEYIAAAKPVRVALLQNAPPYSYAGEDGAVQGVVPAYYQHLAKLSGLKFAYELYPDLPAAVQAVKAGQADVLALYQQDIFEVFKDKMMQTLPYGNLNLVRVTKSGRADLKKWVVAASDVDLVRLAERKLHLPEVTVLPQVADCFEDLRRGRADAVLCDLQTATWFLNQDRVSEYTVISLPGLNWQLYSVLGSNQPLLRSVLNKSILASGNMFDDLLAQQSLEQQSGLAALFNRLPRNWALGITLLRLTGLVLVLAAGWILLRRSRAERALALERERNEQKEAALALEKAQAEQKESALALEKAKAERREAELNALAAANRAKFNFFSNLSHDMRTPLNGILGFTDLALHTENPGLLPDFLRKINISGRLMLDLVNDMLTVSRLENGKLTLNPAPITLFELLENITTPVEVTAANAGVSFSCDKSGAGDGLILADRLNVQKIFLNLISNAIKFTAPGKKVWLKVRTEQVTGQRAKPVPEQVQAVEKGELPAPDKVPEQAPAGLPTAARASQAYLRTIMVVADEGKGISPEFLPHVFEAFAQEKSIRPARNVGTGLGLAIVRQLVLLMGGTITVQSVLGQGSAFTVELKFPLVVPKEQPAAGEAEAAGGAGGTAVAAGARNGAGGAAGAGTGAAGAVDLACLQGLAVLLCEDNDINQELARRLLEAKGMQVTCAADGQEGLEDFKASAPGHFAAILMDNRMPVLDGVEATKAIRALARSDAKVVPVIAFTADVFAEDLQKFTQAGASAHVAKPVEPALLYRTLVREIGRAGRKS